MRDIDVVSQGEERWHARCRQAVGDRRVALHAKPAFPRSATVLRCPEPGRGPPMLSCSVHCGAGFFPQSSTRRFHDSRVRFVPNPPP
jgi:hypothetical protein